MGSVIDPFGAFAGEHLDALLRCERFTGGNGQGFGAFFEQFFHQVFALPGHTLRIPGEMAHAPRLRAPEVAVGLCGGCGCERELVAVDVKQVGHGAFFRFAHHGLVAGQQFADFGMRIVHVARNDRVFGADYHAGGFEADVDAMRAVVALGRRVGVGIDIQGIVRTGLHAGFAADAAVLVEVHDAVGAGVERFHGTDFDAGSIGAVVATQHREQPPGIGESAFFHLFDPGAKHPDGYFVFAFTGGGAGVAADTLAVVDDKTVFHKWCRAMTGVLQTP